MTTGQMQAFQHQVITLAGEMAEMFSFNRSLGQLFGFLYISREPISLEALAAACHMSKGNASLHLRTLEAWGAVHRTWKPGTRKDYYSAADDLKQIAARRLQEGLRKRLDYAHQRLQQIKEDPSLRESARDGGDGAHWSKRLGEIESLINQIESGFNLIPKLFQLKALFK